MLFQKDFDPAHDFIKRLDINENFIKKNETYINKQTGKEGRIILLSSDKSLESFARAKTVSSDGTFKIAYKKLWSQIMIIAAEVSNGIWVPVIFGYLPDKTFAAYLIFFGLAMQCLTELNKTLSAQSFMCDFEKGIRKAVMEIWPHLDLKGKI